MDAVERMRAADRALTVVQDAAAAMRDLAEANALAIEKLPRNHEIRLRLEWLAPSDVDLTWATEAVEMALNEYLAAEAAWRRGDS